MKRAVIGKLLFITIIFIFLLSNAVAVDDGTCGVVIRSACDDPATEGYVVMGLSSSTNAHGEITGTYPYVLCCNIGTGDRTCIGGTLPNTIINLSSSTNAHAELPTQKNYPTGVCYEDFVCIKGSNSCPTNYPLGILSLSADTNAHIGPYDGTGSYTTKICCGSEITTSLTCRITSAEWDRDSATKDGAVYMEVKGSGPECGPENLVFEIWEKDTIGEDDPILVGENVIHSNFDGDGNTNTALSVEWYPVSYVGDSDDGILSGDPEYYFKVSLGDHMDISLESNLLSVSEDDFGDGLNKDYCEDYDSMDECNDYNKQVAKDSNPDTEVDCDDEDRFICGCSWGDGDEDNEAGEECTFTNVEITREDCGEPATGCEFYCTLCSSSGVASCEIGNECSAEKTIPGCLGGICNQSCDWGEGCLTEGECSDGDQDTCSDNTYCLDGKCSSTDPTIWANFGKCAISQKVTVDCEEGNGIRKVILHTAWTEDGQQITDLAGCGENNKCKNCVNKKGERDVKCPAQVQLPFFGGVGIITTVLVIGLIYASIFFQKKFCRKNKFHKSKK